ncbi:phosphate signaling complex protein PhoU [bacterium]|nr:phosphate signaling complex protein PhoU [bacterium]
MIRVHTDREFEQELQEIRETILYMAGRCEQMIAKAVKALVERDSALARETMDLDHLVNRDEVRIDELSLLVLAKRQPMGSDLRFITQIMKMANELERIGDLAVNICERVTLLNQEPPLKPYVDTPKMAEVVQTMVRDAINAFVNADTQLADEVIERDDIVDNYFHRIIRDLLDMMIKDNAVVERGIHVQSIAKFLERMADHATNLAEQVIFMVKGKDVRNTHYAGDTTEPNEQNDPNEPKANG